MLIEALKGVAIGLASGVVISTPAVIWAYFYKRSQRRKRAQ
ncbi:hypothetical protein ACFW2K_22655 [Streptomyces nigra]